jgi:hypothetical protein
VGGDDAADAELAGLNRIPAKKLTKEQRRRRDELSRAWSAKKFPGATPVPAGGGRGPGVSDAENEATAAAARQATPPPAPAQSPPNPVDNQQQPGKIPSPPATGTGGTRQGGTGMHAVKAGDAVKIGRQSWTVQRETTPEGYAESYGIRRYSMYNSATRNVREAVLNLSSGEWSWLDQSGTTSNPTTGGKNRRFLNWRG